MAKTITTTAVTFVNGSVRAIGYSAEVDDNVAADLVAAGVATCPGLDPVDTVRDVKATDGTNGVTGVATLVAGTKVVTNTRITANTRIFLSRAAAGAGAVGHLGVSARVAGTSFTILSTANTDVSDVQWMLVEPD